MAFYQNYSFCASQSLNGMEIPAKSIFCFVEILEMHFLRNCYGHAAPVSKVNPRRVQQTKKRFQGPHMTLLLFSPRTRCAPRARGCCPSTVCGPRPSTSETSTSTLPSRSWVGCWSSTSRRRRWCRWVESGTPAVRKLMYHPGGHVGGGVCHISRLGSDANSWNVWWRRKATIESSRRIKSRSLERRCTQITPD